MFKEFLADEYAWDMFLTGAAGTGKTTKLREYVQHCIDNEIPYIVCAFTHKACGILKSKLPDNANITTLHSYLKKRPTINSDAIKMSEVNNSIKTDKTDDTPLVIFLDEYSMVGDKDTLDIREAQDPEYTGKPRTKLVACGDHHQLPPVGDKQTLKAGGDYHLVLTKQWRNDNPLQIPLNKLISYLDGADPEPLTPVPGYFDRGVDIDKTKFGEPDKIYLAYTNRRVEDLNAKIQGYCNPAIGDEVFSPTTQEHYTYVGEAVNVDRIDLHYTDSLGLGSKYRTLEGLIKSGNCLFGKFENEECEEVTKAYVFGHYKYKVMVEELKRVAVASNKAIEDAYPGYKAVAWSRVNYTHKLARERSSAWREYLSFNDCVVCMDFKHAMTVHKSQGSTYNTVILDTDDLSIAAERDFNLYLTLTYVGISRASHRVITP